VHLGHVSTEGGPLLVGDRDDVVSWRGVEEPGDDYRRACEVLDLQPTAGGGTVPVGAGAGVIWDMPTGTAHVWRRRPNEIVISRAWVDADQNMASFLASLPLEDPVPLGDLIVRSGWIVVLWAAAEGAGVADVAPSDALSLSLVIGNDALIASLGASRYVCYRDEVADGDSSARRCWIVPAATNIDSLRHSTHTYSHNGPNNRHIV
jgi:hypothetical protein